MRRYERVERRRVEVFMGRDKREKFEIYELDIFSFSFNLFVFVFSSEYIVPYFTFESDRLNGELRERERNP